VLGENQGRHARVVDAPTHHACRPRGLALSATVDQAAIAVRAPGLALAATLAVQTLASLVLTTPSVLAPAVAPALGYAPDRVGVFVGLAYFAAMLSGLWGGKGVARIGAVRLSQVALVASALGCVAAAAGHAALLLAAAVVVGTGYGIVNPASTVLLGRHSPPKRRGLFFSIKQTGVPLGVAFAGLSMPWGLRALGWRPSVLVAGACCLLLAVLLAPAVRRLGPLHVAEEDGAADRVTDRADVAAAPAASSGAAALWAVLRDPVLRRLSLTSLTFACTQLAFITFLVSLLNLQLGYSLAWAAAMLAAVQVASTVFRVAFGYVADRWLAPALLLGVLGLAMAAACVGLGLLGRESSTGVVVAAAVFCAATSMGWNGVFFAELTRSAARRGDLASVAGASQFFTFAGSMSGPVLFAEIIRFSGSYSLGYLLLAALPAAAGIWMLWARRRERQR
jgi:MFS family permease